MESTSTTTSTVEARDSSEQLVISGIEVGITLLLAMLIAILYRFKDKWPLKHMKVEYIEKIVTMIVTRQKGKIKEVAIHEVREHKIVIPGADVIGKEVIQELEKDSKEQIQNKLS